VNNFSRRPKSKLSRGALANKQTKRESAADPPSLGSLPFFFSKNTHVLRKFIRLAQPAQPKDRTRKGEQNVYSEVNKLKHPAQLGRSRGHLFVGPNQGPQNIISASG